MLRTSSCWWAVLALLALAPQGRAEGGAAAELAAFAQEHGVGGTTKADCLRCHETLRPLIERAVPHKPVLEGECSSCHSPHAARFEKLLNKRERALCGTCHEERIGEFLKGNVHTPIRQGQCAVCHEVHGSANAALLVKEGNELCMGCHAEKVAQATLPTQHDPFTNGACLDCHAAHNSPFPDQLNAPADKLCVVCHQPEEAELVAAHSDIPVKGTHCTSCHEPHASPSKGLLRANAHAPFAEGSCEMCHATESDTPQVVRATGARLCATCHQDYPRKDHPLVHKPVADGQCNACHAPHATDRKGLLTQDTGPLCTSCHGEILERAAKSKSAHPTKEEHRACLGCHSPHSSTEPALLSAGEIRTCIQCHETAKHGHPLGDDRLDPRTGKAITCVTCHDPHGTEFAYQLRGDQSRGLCVECHDTDHDTKKGKGSGKGSGRGG
jgi:predicted CXXCH cytochrome family protein